MVSKGRRRAKRRRTKRQRRTGGSMVGYRQRIYCLVSGLLLFAAAIFSRLVQLQTREHGRWLELAGRQHNASLRVQGVRGMIEDRFGQPLAVSVPVVSLAAHPSQVRNRPQLFSLVRDIAADEAADFRSRLAENKPFVWVARGLPLAVLQDERVQGVPGLQVIREFRRYYPQGRLAGNVLGFVGRDGNGLAGVEHAFDDQLRARDLKLPAGRDARGTLVAMNDRENTLQSMFFHLAFAAESEAPSPVRVEAEGLELTIDGFLQNVLEEEFETGRNDSQAKAVFGVLLDAETGEILAMAQAPAFDPSAAHDVSSDQLRNAVIEQSFEPGSTLKPMVAVKALEANLVRPQDLFDCENGKYIFGGHTISDVHPLGRVTFRDVLVHSSNIGMSKLGQRFGAKRLYQALKDFGFGATSGVELPGEANGILRDFSRWREIDVATHAFGQGVSVTALQLARGYSVLANGGLLVEPSIIKNRVPAWKRIVSERATKEVSEMLLGVTESESGTGREAAICGVDVYGKTGTAQKALPGRRGYSDDSVTASFVGYVDGTQVGLRKKLTLAVIVDEPGVRPRWGGVVAAPVFRRAMERILSHLIATEGSGLQTAALPAFLEERGDKSGIRLEENKRRSEKIVL